MKIYTNEMIKQKNAKKNKRKKVIKYILTPIMAIILLLCIYIAYQKLILKSPNIELFGYKVYIVLTGSMEPVIKPNDLVIVKKISQEKLKDGDIITFNANGTNTTVTHRITEKVEKDGVTYYKTKGDNNNSEDIELVKYEDIQGVYCFKISKIGVILTGGLTGTGVIIVFLILVISYHHSSKMDDRMLTREEARKRYNIYKYNDKEDTNDTI